MNIPTPTASPPLTFHAPPGRLPRTQILAQSAALGAVGTLLDCMPDLAMILNEQRQIIFANNALRTFAGAPDGEKLLGLRPGELLSCRELANAPSGCGTSEACRTCGAVNAILGALAGTSMSAECSIATSALEAYDLRISASPFLWQSHSYALVIATDISDEKRRHALERIFFHDILNTAGSIQGMTELIHTDPAFNEVFQDDLYETAQLLVNEIQSQRLLLSAERHELAVTLAPVQARAQLEAVAQTYRPHPAAGGKEIAIAPHSADFTFRSDEALLQRVLGNLLKNALEASSPGDTATLGAEESPEHVVFWCHNRQHIPHEIQLQLFKRSFTTKGPGRGLGTYSIRLLTERYLGGTVVLHSEPETGTRFELIFPNPPSVAAAA